MLFRSAILDRIKSGDVTLAFRCWRRPTVKAGGRLRTAIGELAIDSVDRCEENEISEQEAFAAGFAGRAALLAELGQRRTGELYRVAFHLAGPDRRVALRAKTDLSSAEFDAIAGKLAKLDQSGARRWTRATLQHIADHPGLAAGAIATALATEKTVLKRNVRKLKELGLTESLEVGYRLSPRGRAVLDALPRGARVG
ncbi:MAG: hypothetical protein KIT23_01895 [Sphingopyxis sp.]|nr:hypothetical protein [Sphingopyxis sp.]